MTNGESRDRRQREEQFYLPDFCAGRTVLAIVVVAELVAIMLVLGRNEPLALFWLELAKLSMFLLWIGLGSAALLCVLRPWLARFDDVPASVLSFVAMVAGPVLVAEIAYWLGRFWALRVGAYDSSLFPTNHALFLMRTSGVAAIVSGLLLRYFYVSNQWRQNVKREAHSRIRALQARIRPHFLFNSMNTIAALTRSDPVRAEEAVEDLADLFRATLSDARNRIRLNEELELARIYQRIEQLRLGDRLEVLWNLDDLPVRAFVPSLIIQPLLENAINHGIEPSPDGGTVIVEARGTEDSIRICVSNPLPPADDQSERPGNRMALDNIRERLELAYRGDARMDIESTAERFVVCMEFPRRETELEGSYR